MQVPRVRPSWVLPILVANLVGEVLIVVTGGIVRLTGSGLGCPTWPECVPGSFVPTVEQEEGVHKFIEFGNRTLTGLVGLLAIAVIWAVMTRWPARRRMRWLSWLLLAGVAAQAIVGGITVRTGLNPYSVAFHFLASMVLVAISTALVVGGRDAAADRQSEDGPGELLVHPVAHWAARATAVVGGIVLVLGTLVTGSGPHSGDADEPARTGWDPRFLSWMHADTVMLFCGLVIATLVAVHISDRSAGAAPRAWRWVLGVTVLQGFIGYVQYFTKLPEVLVLMHMLGACLLTVALTWGVLANRRRPV